VPPEHEGPLPAVIHGHELYTGSCHCGAVTLAFMSKPLDETFGDLTAECNCSICERVSRHRYRGAKSSPLTEWNGIEWLPLDLS